MTDIVESLVPAGNPATPGGTVYQLMSTAEASAQTVYGDLVNDLNTYTLECYSGEITDSVGWAGWVTDETYNITVKAAAGNSHNGVSRDDGGTGFRITSASSSTVRAAQTYTTFEDIEILSSHGSDATVKCFSQVAGGGVTIANSLILKAPNSPTNAPAAGGNIAGITGHYTNCLIVGPCRGIELRSQTSPTAKNNTVVITGTHGILGGAITNTVVYGATTACYLSSASQTNCASSDSTAIGTLPQTGVTTADLADYAGGDYSPAAGGKLDGTGADLSVDFTTDITGATRTVPWTIGAYIVAGGPPPVGIQEMYIKDGGIFVKYTPHVKVGGTFQEVDAYVLEGGAWVPVHEK